MNNFLAAFWQNLVIFLDDAIRSYLVIFLNDAMFNIEHVTCKMLIKTINDRNQQLKTYQIKRKMKRIELSSKITMKHAGTKRLFAAFGWSALVPNLSPSSSFIMYLNNKNYFDANAIVNI